MNIFLTILVCYLAVNLACALVFHLHGLRQAHLPLRFLDVFMHFLLFGALAIPVLLVMSVEAFFGRGKQIQGRAYSPLVQHH